VSIVEKENKELAFKDEKNKKILQIGKRSLQRGQIGVQI
jgi:hypothetical protein